MLRVTEPTGQRFKIEGRQGRYEGLTIWQTKQCGPEWCKDFREASLTVSLTCREHKEGKACVQVIAEGKCGGMQCKVFLKVLRVLPKLKKMRELEAQGVILTTIWDFSEKSEQKRLKRKAKAEKWLKEFYPKIDENLKKLVATALSSVFGVCTKGVAWKVITKNRVGRKLRACQVNRVDHRSLEEKAQTYKRLAGVFECLSNPDRLRILELLST